MSREEVETFLEDWTEEEISEDLDTRTLFKQTILTPSPVDFRNSGTVSPGQSWTLNTSEFRNGASASSLSRILERLPLPRRFFLTAIACAGILRRAARRGKTLPARLERALAAVAGQAPTKPKPTT